MPVSMRIAALALAVVVVLCGCVAFGPQSKDLPGDYRLVRWEDGQRYYIGKSGEKLEGGGVVGGTVERVGWDDRYIVAWRHAMFGGDPDGWMIIDTHENKVMGPASDDELLKQGGEIPALRGIKPLPAAVVWEGR